MAAWRGRRALTWITGVVAFVGSIATAFTGYLVQQNFDSQWIATEAKDGLNSVGVGAWFNVLNIGQMLLWHVLLLPLALGVLVRAARAAGPPPRGGPADRCTGHRRGAADGGVTVTATGHGRSSRPPRDPAANPGPGRGGGYDIVKEFVIARS